MLKDVFLYIAGTAAEVLIDVYTSKKPKLGMRLLVGFVLLVGVAFIAFLVWNSVALFSQGRIFGGVILGALALIGIISSIVFVVYFHKKLFAKESSYE